MLISARRLAYSYPGAARPAIDGLDFEIAPGEIFGFLGPNGAGKSTTQKVLIGLLRGYRGELEILGRARTAWRRDFYERLGVAFELPNHYLKLTGRENLRYFAALYERPTLAPEVVLESVDLLAAADQPVGQYSKGMRRRLAIARALVHAPELLFLDEPTSGLDPAGARLVKDLIRTQRKAGRTVFLTTHDMTVADELCDRVAFLVDGRIALIDAPGELKVRFGEPQVRVEYRDGDATQRRQFALAGLGENAGFLELLQRVELRTIHSLEATLEEVFLTVTGRSLS